MSFMSYAQNFEDVLLWRALGHVENGFYLDIGAQHPAHDSVSRGFYEAGWRGMHVEPSAAYAALLREDRPDEVVLEAAVGERGSVLTFHEIAETGLSTGDADIAASHRRHGFASQQRTIPCVTLESVFDSIGDRDIHWMKIDVEGMEQQVLSGWGASAARPWILVIESTYPLSQMPTQHAWQAFVTSRGYSEVFFDGLNRYYVSDDHPALRDAFEAPANVFDDVVLHPGHGFCRAVREAGVERAAALETRLAADAARLADAGVELENMRAALEAAQLDLARERQTTAELRQALEAYERVPEPVPARDLADLLESRDEIFVERAYLTLLGRRADPDGRAYYVARLRAGIDRIHMLDQLSRSEEARRRGVTLPGLAPAMRRARLARLPIAGPLLGLLNGAEGNAPRERRLRRIENGLFALLAMEAPAKTGRGTIPATSAQSGPIRIGADGEPALDGAFTPRARVLFRKLRAAHEAKL